MANVKPASVGATTNPPSASALIKKSGGTFVINMWKVRARHKVNDWKLTMGDGDATPVYEHNQLQDGFYTIIGSVVSGAEIGIEQLSGTSNPGTFKLIRESGSGAGTTQTVSMLVLEIEYDWEHKGVYMPLMIRGIVTGTTASAIEATT